MTFYLAPNIMKQKCLWQVHGKNKLQSSIWPARKMCLHKKFYMILIFVFSFKSQRDCFKFWDYFLLLLISDGPGSKCLIRVRSGQPSMVRVSKISTINIKFSVFFCFWSKTISLNRVKKYRGQSQVGLLFNAGQK